MDLKKKVIPAVTATLLACASFLCADDATGGQGQMTMMEPQGDMMMGANEMNAPSARPYWQDTTGKMHVDTGAILDVELLVWQAHTDDLDVAVTNDPFPTSVSSPNFASRFLDAEYEHMSFKWDVGVRVGLGYYFEHDNWDVYAAWTHIHNKASKTIDESVNPNLNATVSSGPATAANTQTLFPTWSSALVTLNPAPASADPTRNGNLTASGVDAHWKLKLDLIDAELGRLFFAGRWLTVRPHFGLRGGWIKQTFDVDYTNVIGSGQTGTDNLITFDDIDMKNDFKGIGVRAGIDTQWHFCSGVCFYGDAAVSVLYGRYNISQQETNIQDSFATVSNLLLSTTDNFNDSKAITDLALGLCWQPDLSCMCNTMRFTLAAGWEHHMFFNQVQLKRVYTVNYQTPSISPNSPSWTNYVREMGDLSTQGVTVTARFEF